ncbi:hypothetical protein Ancab_030222 [Ancistrocladus abbreviatus]
MEVQAELLLPREFQKDVYGDDDTTKVHAAGLAKANVDHYLLLQETGKWWQEPRAQGSKVSTVS